MVYFIVFVCCYLYYMATMIGSPAPASTDCATLSFIGGGGNNSITPPAATNIDGSAIVSGRTNQIASNCAFIGGGNNNILTGDYSAILGGANNSDGGNSFTGIFGNNLIATTSPATMGVPSAMWVDELVIQNLPVDTTVGGTGIYASLPIGALYTNVAIGGGFLARQVFIK